MNIIIYYTSPDISFNLFVDILCRIPFSAENLFPD